METPSVVEIVRSVLPSSCIVAERVGVRSLSIFIVEVIAALLVSISALSAVATTLIA